MRYSQLGQDDWVLKKTSYKQNGTFIEFGAYDGLLHSNTAKLEKEYGWSGLCCEPNKKQFKKLIKNRNCVCTNDCVYTTNNEVMHLHITAFNEELSGIPQNFQNDAHTQNRQQHTIQPVITITLTELCQNHQFLPHEIDYLSIDTEGSELDILKAHDFSKYWFKYITIEHNNISTYRQNIETFLNSKHYQRDKSANSQWDDWYVLC